MLYGVKYANGELDRERQVGEYMNIVWKVEWKQNGWKVGITHDVCRVWGWWDLVELLATFLKEIPPIPRI